MNSGEQYTYQGTAYVCKVPLSGTPYAVPANTMLACGITEGRLQQIHTLLDTAVDYEGPEHLMDSASAPGNYPQIIYDIQELTANVLKAGENCKDTYILDKLATLYALPFNHMQTDPEGNSVWVDTTDPSGHENTLYSTQFMYAVAKLVNVIAHIDQSAWTTSMYNFMYTPRAHLKAHLERWLFKPSFAACNGYDKTYTLPQITQKKYERSLGPPGYCNAIAEGENWPAAAAAEFLSATGWVGLSADSEAKLRQSVRDAARLFESRLSTRDACPNNGCRGLLLDEGGWSGHPEYPSQYWPSGTASWDFSHMRRIVQWVDAYYLHPDISGASYSSYEGVVALLANELAFQVFNRDYANPAFANFWNGWNYPYRTSGPWELSSSYYRAGYGFWGYYRSDVQAINDALLRLVDNKIGSWYMNPNGAPPGGAYDLLGFYSSLTHP